MKLKTEPRKSKQRAGSLKDCKSKKFLVKIGKEKKKKTQVTNVRNETGFH